MGQDQKTVDRGEQDADQVKEFGAEKMCTKGSGSDGKGDHGSEECHDCHQPRQRIDRILQGTAHYQASHENLFI